MPPLSAIPAYDLAELARRLANVVRRAVVAEVDPRARACAPGTTRRSTAIRR